MTNITFEDVYNNTEFKSYIEKGNELLGVLGFTEHSTAHTMKVAQQVEKILTKLNYPARETELAKIAGYIHDIGNMVNRVDHAQTGAIMAFNILTRMGMPPEEIAVVVGAIGNHDEKYGLPVSPACAALIISDKSDVRRSRVRNSDFSTFDIHDRVNYSVQSSSLEIFADKKTISLDISIDTKICSVLDYFEIFLSRMLMCKRAAEFLEITFEMIVNGSKVL